MAAPAFMAAGTARAQETDMLETSAQATQTSGFAQPAQTAIIINDKTSEYAVAPFVYHTRDAAGELSSREIFLRHQNNLRGDRINTPLVNLSLDPVPHWLLFDIRNDSHRSDWVLDLGPLTLGRTGIAPRFFVQNAQNGSLLANGLQKTSRNGAYTGYIGRAVPLELLPGQSMTLLVYAVPSDHAPFVLAPRITTASNIINDTDPASDFWLKNIVLAMLAGSSLFFVGGLMLRSGLGFFPHALFFASQAFWFWLSANHVFAGIPAGSDIQGIALATGALMALASTQSIVISQEGDGADSVFLYICASLVLVAIILFTFLLPEGSGMRLWFIGGATVFGYAVSALKALSIRSEMRWAGLAAGMAWLFMLAGNAVSYLSGTEKIPLLPDLIQAPWLVMPLVSVLLILSGIAYLRATNTSLIREIMRQAQRLQKNNSLKQSRESADQARLLRVIEREREIMTDLRSREAERTEEMRLAKISADEANRAKSAFLAIVSHEIRTPMTGIMGMVRLLLDTSLTNEQRDYTQTIQDSGDAMLALLNDILDFSKIESGGMDIESIDFDIHRVISSVSLLMNGHATNRGIYLNSEIDIDAPKYLKGDPTRLRQVLLNLVGNAIKFTSRGGVTIRLLTGDPALATGDKLDFLPLVIEVEDTGIGISEEAQKNLFNPFSQADSSIARKFGGTGLGLAICKRLIQAMGGEITLKSIEGKGTTFVCTLLLPAGDQEKADDSGTATDTQGNTNIAKPMDVLVVDDNAINRKVMEGLLGRDKHRVVSVASGQDALHILQERLFDIVFMDIEMPGMNGVETMRHILASSNADIKAIPVVALTGNVSETDRANYLAAGMQDTLAKPIDPEALRATLVHFGTLKLGNNFGVAAQAAPPSWELSDEDLGEDSFSLSVEYEGAPAQNTEDTNTAPKSEQANEPVNELLDDKIFSSLVASLGKNQLKEMLEGVIAHNNTVLPNLQMAFNEDDTGTLRGCAHELKGMNGNFGLKEIARITAIIEKACMTGELPRTELEELIFNALPAAMQQTEKLLMQAE